MSKIQNTLKSWPYGTVALTHWLEQQGISRQLIRRYRQSGWIEPVGIGAVKRTDEPVDWLGAVYAMQQQIDLAIHPGARTALILQGLSHYIYPDLQSVDLFAPFKVNLPGWFLKHDWGVTPQLIRSCVLPVDIGHLDHSEKTFSVRISAPERALLECLYLAPHRFELMECFQMLEGLPSLRPTLLQNLLEQCSSIKVKRLFLYLAGKTRHPWLRYLDVARIDLGHGPRSFAEGGVYDRTYQIVVPEELARL